MNEAKNEQQQRSEGPRPAAVQTTGHAWDGDIQEFNNPLPRWWLWAFYGTVVFAVIYFFVYPSWPVGGSWTKGLGSVSYTVDGQEQEMRWNTRSLLLADLHDGDAAVRQRQYLEQVAQADFDTIAQDAEMLSFVRSIGSGLFGDNCAACHGRGGQGVMGQYPNLTDDAWLWGGTMADIEQTLHLGRNGYMPGFKATLNAQQLDDVAEYVLSLSGEAPASEATARGEAIFQGDTGGCYMCHGADAMGIQSMGAANLTDKVWTLVDVPSEEGVGAKRAVLREFISGGVPWNSRMMPAWPERLTDTEIKVLAVYVHQLGGGQ